MVDEIFASYLAQDRPAVAGRPWVLANMVSALDGSAALGGRVGRLTSDVDQELFRRLRSLADVVLVGAGTVRAERYGSIRLAEADVERRAAEGRPEPPRLAVVSRSLDLDWSGRLFTEPTARPLVLTVADADAERVEAAAEVADVVALGSGEVDLGAALAALHDAGVSTVLNEGGPSLLGELIGAHLLDELCLTLTPLIPGDPLRVVRAVPGAEVEPLRLAHVERAGDELFLRYLVERSQ